MPTQKKKKKPTSSSRGKRRTNPPDHSREIILWSAIALAALMGVSVIGFGGILGAYLAAFLFGIFGIVAFVLPLLLLFLTFFLLANPDNAIAYKKSLGIVLLLLDLQLLMELIRSGSHPLGAIESMHFAQQAHWGGGMIGGALAQLAVSLIGLAGGYILLLFFLVIAIILITERSLIDKIKQQQGAFASKAQERGKAHALRRQIRQEERKAKREEELAALEARQIEAMAQAQAAKEARHTAARKAMESGLLVGDAADTASAKAQTSDEMREIKIHLMDEASKAEEAHKQEPIRIRATAIDEEIKEEIPEDMPSSIEARSKNSPTQQEIAETNDLYADGAAGSLASVKHTDQVIDTAPSKQAREAYHFPPVSILSKSQVSKNRNSRSSLEDTAMKLETVLSNFGVNAHVTDVAVGPAVTRYEIQPEVGVKVSRIVNLADDIKLNLAAADIRIEAPIPGKAAVGIEVPNQETQLVPFRDLMESTDFQRERSNIAFALGRDIGGKVMISNIAKMPHLLIAGATGSGKSVCINTIIMSILYKAHPDDVKFIMIDPKVVELSVYNGIPHLLIPVVTDPKKAAGALHWAVKEMEDRYQKFAQAGVRNIEGYNEQIKNGLMHQEVNGEELHLAVERMPQIVVIVDELADLMMVASSEVEEAICRLAQLARAAGIHLIIATQRPSVNVITGLIKANMPSRIAFAVTSGVDSRTILDMVGAEKLLGKGDMLYHPQGIPKPLRVQGAFVPDEDVAKVVDFIKKNNASVEQDSEEIQKQIEEGAGFVPIEGNGSAADDRDPLLEEAARIIIQSQRATAGGLQRQLKIGFNRAARIMDQLAEEGVIGENEGTKARKVLMTMAEFEEYLQR